MKTLYTAKATAKGGRKGHVKTEDGPIDMPLSMPKELGGDGGDGVNPEQLFGSAYSACFGSALSLVAEKHNVDLGDFSVSAHISINKEDEGGLLLSAVLDSYLPGVKDIETGEKLVNEAHEVCPFSRATRDNMDVTLNLLQD
ncbi:organic hydroperoxide resistance protein [Psychroflexus tropicus]|uniref:organic hydroperoxide resistance protein n=1 Tax=Psychroflexus tropicus TaxID=197345 RepID=UPI000378D3F5|nr:organic hydroperoxide resistance protein [Psychroflexus tropicus]